MVVLGTVYHFPILKGTLSSSKAKAAKSAGETFQSSKELYLHMADVDRQIEEETFQSSKELYLQGGVFYCSLWRSNFPILKGTLSSGAFDRLAVDHFTFQSSKELYLRAFSRSSGGSWTTFQSSKELYLLKAKSVSDHLVSSFQSSKELYLPQILRHLVDGHALFPILKGTLSSPKNIAIATIFMVHHLPLHLI